MEDRCWLCGTKFVDSSRLKNKREGFTVTIYKPTGKMVCPYGCPTTKEELERIKNGEEILPSESH